tara:strand:- start:513 stop:1619 length:1107 start_codon:yes stop_codon:yes gene_type:complete
MVNVGKTNLRTVATTVFILSSVIPTSKSFGATISTIAGTGSAGFSGDGGLATSATFNPAHEIFRVAVDSDGNIYVADVSNHRIRKITVADGKISTIAGTGAATFSGDGGLATSAGLSNPTNVALDQSGNLYILDSGNNRVRKVVLASGVITTVAGPTGVSDPRGIEVNTSGTVYVTDTHGSKELKKIDGAGNFVTVIGGFNYPHDLAVDGSGNIYVANAANGSIDKVVSDGSSKTTFLGSLNDPRSVDIDSQGYVYVATRQGHQITKIHPTGAPSEIVAGTGSAGFSGDGGQAVSAQLNQPMGVAVDGLGNIYIADTENRRIRKVIGPPPPQLPTGGSREIIYVPFASKYVLMALMAAIGGWLVLRRR